MCSVCAYEMYMSHSPASQKDVCVCVCMCFCARAHVCVCRRESLLWQLLGHPAIISHQTGPTKPAQLDNEIHYDLLARRTVRQQNKDTCTLTNTHALHYHVVFLSLSTMMVILLSFDFTSSTLACSIIHSVFFPFAIWELFKCLRNTRGRTRMHTP